MRLLLMGVLIISVPIIIIMNATLGFLITENDIKPNKLTKLFYSDDESFIEFWEKRKEKGMLLHNLKNFIFLTAWYGIMGFVFFTQDNNIMYGHEHILLLCITTIIFSLISSIIAWGQEYNRYIKLKEKLDMEIRKN
ncbi:MULTISPECIES: hypothetical protein [Clostridium]|uniref:SdpI/YhfL protein family protein n=1 Tax=Clostridium frigoriphilum TaxID=443253 RepID=A0ABU7UNG6_9CLOT|nr:hypothetical protein [Clostridium sp. DSM 17811]MBU3098940.1 hypothetical protein [Clostridium sp. DSM 17811]